MKTLPYIALLVLGVASQLHSQVPATAKTPLQILQGIKEKNHQIIERQNATMLKLGELQKESAQLKAFSKRS